MYRLIYIFPVDAFARLIPKVCILVIWIVIFWHYLMDFSIMVGDKGNVIAYPQRWTSPKILSINDNGFGVAIFHKSLNNNKYTNTYNQIELAIITTFVSITTGENYDLANAELAESNTLQWYKVYFSGIVVINLFCLIPVLIERFEKAYSLTNDARLKKHIDIQTNAIIASFIMLDIDTNQRNFFHQKQHLSRAIKCKSMNIGPVHIIYGFKFVCKWQLIHDSCITKENTSIHQQTN